MNDFVCISSALYPDNGEPIQIKIDLLDHKSGVAHLCKGFDIAPSDWPDGYGISNEIVTLSTHQGTHIDAPMHYYPDGSDIVAADINNFIGNAVVFTDKSNNQFEIEIEWIDFINKLEKYKNKAKAVFFITGAYKNYGHKDYFYNFKGIPEKYIEAAIDLGFSVIGTDAFSVDPPFAVMSKAFIETKDQSKLWPAHVLGRKKNYFQIERLCHLEPFEHCNLVEFIALPVKLHCGAAWTRAVARIIE